MFDGVDCDFLHEIHALLFNYLVFMLKCKVQRLISSFFWLFIENSIH